jgi:O-antigen/teichoic acid export membrane protein
VTPAAIRAEPPDERPAAAQGSLAILVSFAVIAVLNYGFAVVMSWLLPVDGYGVLGIAQAILFMASTVVSAGLPWALAHAMARTEDPARRARAFRTGFAANLALGGAIGAVVAAAALSGMVRPVEAYAPTLIAVAVTTVVLSSNAILASTLQGLLRLTALAIVRASEVLVKTVIGVALVLLGLGTTGAVVGFLVGAALATSLAAWLLRDLPLAAGPGRGDRRLYRAARPFFIGMVGFALVSQLDILTVKWFSAELQADHLAGQYQVALTLSRVPFFAAMALFGAIFPYVARDLGRGDVARAHARLALKYTLLFIVPVGLVLMAIPEAAIRLFFSAKYDQSATPLAYAAAASIILTMAYGVSILLQAQGRAELPAVALTVSVPAQLILATLAVPALGMTGAALAMGAAAMLVLVILAPPVIRSFRIRPSAGEAVRYAAALAVLAGTLAFLPHWDRLTTVVSLATAALVYLIALTVLRLITARDVETLGGALGSRGLPVRRRIAGVIDAVQSWPLPR